MSFIATILTLVSLVLTLLYSFPRDIQECAGKPEYSSERAMIVSTHYEGLEWLQQLYIWGGVIVGWFTFTTIDEMGNPFIGWMVGTFIASLVSFQLLQTHLFYIVSERANAERREHNIEIEQRKRDRAVIAAKKSECRMSLTNMVDQIKEQISEADEDFIEKFERRIDEMNERCAVVTSTVKHVRVMLNAEPKIDEMGDASVHVSWKYQGVLPADTSDGELPQLPVFECKLLRTSEGIEHDRDKLMRRSDVVCLFVSSVTNIMEWTDDTVQSGRTYNYYLTASAGLELRRACVRMGGKMFYTTQELREYLGSQTLPFGMEDLEERFSLWDGLEVPEIVTHSATLVDEIELARDVVFQLRKGASIETEPVMQSMTFPLANAQVRVTDQDEEIERRRKRVARLHKAQEIEEEENELGIQNGRQGANDGLAALFERRRAAVQKRQEYETRLAEIEQKMEEEGWPEEDREIMREEMATLLSK